MPFEKIKTLTVRENFVRELENKIISGELKPGDKLPPAKDMCAMMGVSLTIVNAGMSELVSKGFVETVPRRGSYVADYKKKGNTDTFISIMRYNGGKLTADEVRSFTETRMAIDPFVARLVVERASDGEIEQLSHILDEMRQESNSQRLSELVVRFYHRLTVISGNSFMALLYRSTAEPQSCVYRMYFEKNGTETTVANCEKLYELLRNRDAEKACQLMLYALNTALEGDMAVIQ